MFIAISVVFIIGLISLMLLGVPVAVTLASLGILGMLALLGGFRNLVDVGYIAWGLTNNFVLVAIPLFIFMAEVFVVGGASQGLYKAVRLWLSRLPGSLVCATVAANAIFGAICGASVAATACIGGMSFPEIERYNVDKKLSLGALAAGGTLSILIPPSIAMIVYASLANVSPAHLFIAGIIPGIIITLMFMIYIMVRVKLNPTLHPVPAVSTWGERFTSLGGMAPTLMLVIGIFGGIYTGVMTATEAAGVGSVLAIAIVVAQRRIGLGGILTAARTAAVTTATIILIIIGAQIVTFVFGYLGMPRWLANYVSQGGYPPALVLILIVVVYSVLGMLMDTISLLVLTMPFIYPIAMTQGWDPIWFGVIVVLLCEIGLITPPVGMNLFILDSITGKRYFNDIVMGAIPFVLLLLVAIVVFYAWPDLVTWLPRGIR